MAKVCIPRADGLLPAALRSDERRGRRFPETEHPFRNPFQRDRDRIIHSAAFRRLEYKTQVFVNGEGDHYRTRLTHTLEVTQISRTLARALHINEDLAEAVALSHDLGHTPFGHAGERELDSLLANAGGFNHNFHGLRVVDLLEKRYTAFDGLNLNYEVREAFIRHACHSDAYTEFAALDKPLLEIAVTMVADDIAYLAHDIDDGLYSRILDYDTLAGQALWRRAIQNVPPDASRSLKRCQGVRHLINVLVTDVVVATMRNLERLGYDHPDSVRQGQDEVVAFTDEVEAEKKSLKDFLFDNFYRHPNVMAQMDKARHMLSTLWKMYVKNPDKMPREYQKHADIEGVIRAASDYVAGMTDRFATDEFTKNFLTEKNCGNLENKH